MRPAIGDVMTDLRIAALCYRYAGRRCDTLKTIDRLLHRAESADIVLLPEDSAEPNGTTGEPVPGAFTEWLQNRAAFHGVTLIANLMEEAEEGRFSTCCIIGHTGAMMGKYRKIQLSYSDRCHRGLIPGGEASVFKWNRIRFGVAVCYDTWYPEVIRLQALRGAQIVFAPFKEESRFLSRARTLISARAIENLMWMVCCGGGSSSQGLSYQPFAWVVSPSGEMVSEQGNGEVLIYHLKDIEKTRKEEKALKNWNRPFDALFSSMARKDPLEEMRQIEK